jgi:hypothetical protein
MVYREEYHREVKVTLYLYFLFLVVADFCGDTIRLWRIQIHFPKSNNADLCAPFHCGLADYLQPHSDSFDNLTETFLYSLGQGQSSDPEPVLLNVYGAPELIPRNESRQSM